MAPMHVKNSLEVPEYEIDPEELDFTDSVEIAKVIQGPLAIGTKHTICLNSAINYFSLAGYINKPFLTPYFSIVLFPLCIFMDFLFFHFLILIGDTVAFPS